MSSHPPPPLPEALLLPTMAPCPVSPDGTPREDAVVEVMLVHCSSGKAAVTEPSDAPDLTGPDGHATDTPQDRNSASPHGNHLPPQGDSAPQDDRGSDDDPGGSHPDEGPGQLVALAFTGIEPLVAAMGEDQSWVAIPTASIEETLRGSGATALLVDPRLPEPGEPTDTVLGLPGPRDSSDSPDAPDTHGNGS